MCLVLAFCGASACHAEDRAVQPDPAAPAFFEKPDGLVPPVPARHPRDACIGWSFAYPTTYRDRYRYLSGPRATPALDGGRAYTCGAQGMLHCFDLKTSQRKE